MEDEVLLENTTLGNDDTSSDEVSSVEENSLEERLDTIEALLNENITLMEQRSEDAATDLVPEQSSVTESVATSSGATTSGATTSGVESPDYAQYIYDLLLDSNIKVEVVEEKTIMEKPLNEYNVIEGFSALGIVFGLVALVVAFTNKYTFKRR